MRRYRFGGIAALIALVHLAAVTVLGAFALATDRGDLLWRLVTRSSSMDWYTEPGQDTFALPWGLTLLLIPIGALQAWALWQVLRGPARGEPARQGRNVALLRLALYAGVACGLILVAGSPLILALQIYWIWSAMGIVSAVVQLAVIWLFFLVLRDTVSRGLRVFSLVAGTVAGVSGLGQEIAGLFDAFSATRILDLAGGYGFVWMAWCVSILISQARDRRWSAATVRIGVIAQVVALLQPSGLIGFGGNGFPFILTVYTLLGAVSVFGLVWHARTAHELAGPVPPPLPQREPARAAGRAAARWWPLAALAVALPLVPAALNLTRGRFLSIGPRGVIEEFVRVNGGGTNAMAWFALDAFVGVGGPALLVLVAVLRRTRRVLRTTTLALSVAAAVAAVSASRATPPSWEFGYEGTQIYPEGMFTRGADGEVFLGISPSWYGAALLASALLLLVLYPAAPARRVRRHVLLAGLATLLVVAFVPAADQTRGPVTAAEDCVPHDRWTGEPQVPELTRDQRLVCSLRQANVIAFAATTPDSVILAHARRLCGVYTRNDPEEVARLRAVEGLTREVLTYPLAQVCPSAAAVVSAAAAERERENQEWEDDARRMCDASPRHRPRIEPARAVRLREPQWTDYGVLDAYEPAEDGADPFEDGLLERAQDDGLVAALPGHLMVLTHSDYDICVTLETYDRRPPVETKGWDHVAEVGYRSPTGRIVLRDDLSGTELPDLSLDGRAGHYRIRVHYDWFDWKGPQAGGQRLLIMAFPGKGDRPVTHRKPRKRG